MKKLKKIIAAFLVATMLFGVAACGGSSTTSNAGEAGSTTAVGSDEVIEIKLSTRWGGEEPLSVYYRQKIEEFNSKNNGIKIVADNVTEEKAYFDKLTAQQSSGQMPNIYINYGATRIKDMVESDMLLDLEPYFAKDKAWKDSFQPLFDKWQFADKEGQTFGVPAMLYVILLYGNEEILTANGLSMPTTFADLEAACETLLQAGVTPFQLGEKSNFRAGHFLNNITIRTYGPDAVSKLADRSLSYDSPEMLKMYGIIKDFNDKGYFGENAVGIDNNAEKEAFLSGKSAFRYDGAWFVGEIEASSLKGKALVAAFPEIEPQYSKVYQGGAGQGFSVVKNKDEKINDAAVEVIKYLTSVEYYKGLEKVNSGGIYPVKFESDPETKIDEMTVKIKEIISDVTAFKDDMQNYDPETHMLDTVRNALQGLFIGSTPEKCAQEIISAQQIK